MYPPGGARGTNSRRRANRRSSFLSAPVNCKKLKIRYVRPRISRGVWSRDICRGFFPRAIVKSRAVPGRRADLISDRRNWSRYICPILIFRPWNQRWNFALGFFVCKHKSTLHWSCRTGVGSYLAGQHNQWSVRFERLWTDLIVNGEFRTHLPPGKSVAR